MNTARVTYAFAGAVGSFAMPMDGRTLIEGEAHELAAGFVLACQSVPLTEELALEFDES